MATRGVPLNIPRERIIESIKSKKGIVTQICKDLSISYGSYYEHIKSDPEFKALIDRERQGYTEEACDLAETVLLRGLNHQDIYAALASAKFTLNNLGKSRGYSPNYDRAPEEASDTITVVISDMKDENGRNRIKLKSVKESEGSDSEA